MSYAVPELIPVTVKDVAVTRTEFAREYSVADESFSYTSYPDRWASLTAAHETTAEVVEQIADTCVGSRCSTSAETRAASPNTRRHTDSAMTAFCPMTHPGPRRRRVSI